MFSSASLDFVSQPSLESEGPGLRQKRRQPATKTAMSGVAAGNWVERGSSVRERAPVRAPPHDGRIYGAVKTLEDVESSTSSSVIARAISLQDGGNIFDATGLYMSGSSMRRNFEGTDSREGRWSDLERPSMPGVTTLEEAIESGVPRAVQTILAQIGNDKAVEALTMFEEKYVTTALTRERVMQNPGVFLAIQEAMRQYPVKEQVVRTISYMDVSIRFRVLGYAIEEGDLAIFTKVLNELSNQDGNWLNLESSNRYPELLLLAVTSGNVAMFDRVVDVLGSKMGATQGLRTGDTHVYGHWSVRLLHRACLHGDIDMLNRLMDTFPEVSGALSVTGKWFLLEGVTAGANVLALERIVELLGGQMKVVALSSTQVNLQGNRVLELLRTAIRTEQLDMAHEITRIFHLPLARADFQGVDSLKSDYRGFFVPLRFEEWCPGWALIWDAASTGNMTMFNDVVRLLTPQVIRLAIIESGVALFEAAVKGGDALLVTRVVQIVGEQVIEIAAEKGTLELLDSATRTGNIVLFTCLEDMLGELAVKAAADEGGAALLEAAIRDKNLRMVDHVVETLGHAVVKRAVYNRGVVLLRCAVQSADVALVERVAGIMGQTAVKIAADKRGKHLLEDAIRLSDVNLLRRVVKILGPTAMRFALDDCGTAFLKEVVSRGDVAQIEFMAETLGDTLAKVIDESGAMLLGSAIIRGEVAIVDTVAEILGETAMKTIGFRHGAGYIESSIMTGDVTLVQCVTELLGPTTVKIAADENAVALLSAAIGSGNVLVLDRVAKILGSTMLGVVFERNGLPLLRRAISHGSVTMVIRLAGIMEESVMKSTAESDGIALLESAIRRGDVALVEAVAEALGDTAIQNAAVKRVPELLGAALSCGNVGVFEHVAELIGDTLVKSMPEKYGTVLLQFVMCLGDVALVERVVEILGNTMSKIAAVEGATAFLESVISRGDVALVQSVACLVGDEAVRKACKESPALLLGSAVKRGNCDMIEYVASVLGPRQVEIATAETGMSLLKTTVRHGNVELLRMMVGILGSAAVQVATEQIGPSLFKNAVRNGDAALAESVAEMLGDAVLKKAADRSGMEYLEDAIRRGDVTLVDAVAKILGNEVVSVIAEKCGPSLLGAALTSGDLGVFECVVGLLGDAAVKSSATEAGTAFLRAAVSRGNVALVERIAGILGEKIKAVAMENGPSLLGSAIRYGDTVLLESVVKILGGTVVQSAANNGGVAFLKSAVSRNDVALVRRVADMLGMRVLRGIVEDEGYNLLHLAIRSGSLGLVEAVEGILGEVVKAAAEKNGIVLLDMAIMHGDIPLFDRVFHILGHRVMEIAADKYVLRLLLQAVRHGDTSLVQRVADIFGDTRLSEVVGIAAGHGGTALLEYAVGLVDIFPMERLPKHPGGTSVNTAIEMIAASLLNMAIIRDKMELIEHVADILGDEAQRRGVPVRAISSIRTPAQAERLVNLRVVFQKCLHEIAKENAAGARLYNKLLGVLSKQPRDEEFVAELITTQPPTNSPVGDSVLDAAVAAGNVGIVQASIDHMSKSLSLCQVVQICTACLERVRIEVDSPQDIRLRSMESLALMLQAGAKPQPRQIAQLILLDDEYLRDLRACILSAVCSARNPFIPGTSLLVTLDAAARISPDEEQRVLQGLGDDVSRLLLEILEQLPKTVDAIPGTMATCSSLFESNAMETQPTGFTGPLGVALIHQQTMEIICTRPLVLDFMIHRFDGLLHQADRVQGLSMEERILIEFHKSYKVPKCRMGLDVLVYLIVLVYFSRIVLLHDGPMAPPEQLAIVYVLAAYMTEVSEIARDIQAYVRDRWNVLDFLALGTLAAGWGVRMFKSRSLWGRALYAVAAPLLFSRLLFFAEFLPFQGPMIQVIFSMTGELLKFAVVMLVVIFGFALSFLALFQKSWDLTYGDACLYMFKAMLGDVDLFDEISGERNVAPATLLLVLYILLMSIMLLNLLIAVLSTAHSNVHEDGAKSYKVSKARLITYYVWVTKHDVLPAPFNLIQRLLAMPFGLADFVARRPAEQGLYRHAKKVFGMMTFWAIFCPAVVVYGSLRSLFFLRFIEALEFQGRARESILLDMDESNASVERLPVFRERMHLLLSLPIVNAVYLVVLWLWGALKALRSLAGACYRWNKRRRSANAAREDAMGYVEMDVSSMLEKSPGGLSVTQLQKYLDDSMSDPTVREDERTLPTKVEHLKLLRDRLEVTLTQGMERTVNARVGEVEGKLGALTSKVEAMEDMFRSVARKIDSFGEKLDGVRRA